MSAKAGALAASPPAARGLLRPLLIVLVLSALTAALLGLGVWQLERRAWKLDLIAHVEQRVHAAPVPAPGPADWPRLNAENGAYRHIAVSGHYLQGYRTLVQAVTEYGPGYWVLVPFETDAGFRLLVNRGYVTPAQAAAGSSAYRPPMGEVSLAGLLRISEPGGAFLRANRPAEDRWFSRDVAAIAAAEGLGAVAPYFIDADAVSPTAVPVGGLTVISFPNNHLVYALTWFGLAIMVAGWTVYLLREELRHPEA